MKKIICILSMLSILLASCNKTDSSYISSIDVTIDFLRLDFNEVEKRNIEYFQIVGDELYYTINASFDDKGLGYNTRTVSLNKINIKTNEITKLRTFDETTSEYLSSFAKKNDTMYYSLMTVSDDFEQQNPYEYNVYIETDGNQHCIDTIYLYGSSDAPSLFVANDEVFYTTNDTKIEDTLLGTGQYGFKVMTISNNKAIEIFSSYAPMEDFTIQDDFYERLIRESNITSDKYITFKTAIKSETFTYVYNTETKDLERIEIGHNVATQGMFNNQLLLVNYKDFNKLVSDQMHYELYNIETKERSDCGDSLYLLGITLSKDILIAYQNMQPLSAVYIDKEGQMQLVPIKNDKFEVKGGTLVLPITETSFLVRNSYFDHIVELEIK